jgi:UDP-N-acetylmuramoylalanine--D-glutamate ligase
VAVLNADDHVGRGFAEGLASAVRWTGRCDAPRSDGAFLLGDAVVVRSDGREVGRFGRDTIRLRADHNLANVLAACATAAAIGVPVTAMEATARSFAGVPHRLQVVGRANGATWIDDSIATSPERTIAGIRAFHEPVVLLLGGREKNLPLEGLADEITARARGIVCFGEAGALFYERLGRHAGRAALVRGLDEAVEAAAGIVQDGDVVLLSPAGTSFDAYPNFEARGDSFALIVRALPGFEAEATD